MIKKLEQYSDINLNNSNLKIALVVSKYHSELTQSMERSCKEFLVNSGVSEENILSFYVPGSWEIPILVQNLALQKYDGIVAFGVIIKGETYHFEMIADQVAKALMKISLANNVPIAFEVLATYTLNQAKKRSIGDFNKGKEAAMAILEIIQEIFRAKKISGSV